MLNKIKHLKTHDSEIRPGNSEYFIIDRIVESRSAIWFWGDKFRFDTCLVKVTVEYTSS